ncbi:MAG: hypothetical protein PPP56_10820 [Longimonas sp.]|uniref:hypothetical protein n=1 Tax=Longimonas sp. TaxID=2039626 RepID=UPI00335AE4FB
MAGYPTPSAYQEAIQFPETAFLDDVLQNATPRTNVLGLPQPISGAFAVVFPMTTEAGRTWAAKCFLTDVSDQRSRYRAVASYLADHPLSALVAFDYQQPGIRVEGDTFPLLKMEWVEGTALNTWIREHRDDTGALKALVDAWVDLISDLEDAQIAHGDLQHGNVLVQDNAGTPALRLVDYDTMYVPALDGRESPEVGHRNYQHPDRTERDFGPGLDRFAGLVVYTALHATIARPALWERFDTGENLLFRDSDFYDPDDSPLFDALHATDALDPLASTLKTACYATPDQLPSLQDVVSGAGLSTSSVNAVAVQTRRAERTAPRTAPRSAWARWFLPTLVAMTGLAVVLGGLFAPVVGVVIGALGLAALGGGAAYRYRDHPIVRRQRRLQHEIDRYTALIDTMERELDTLAKQKEEVKTSVEERRADRLEEVRDEALYDELKYHFIGEVGAVDGVRHRDVVQLKAHNIRTAYEASAEAVAPIHRISDATKARIQMWRNSLKQSYADAIPDSLSPAEERRLQRYIVQRVERIETEAARVREKIRIYEAERRRVQQRAEEQPALSVARYTAHLLYLTDLPAAEPGPPRPASPSKKAEEAPSSEKPFPAPVQDEVWWRQPS